MNMDLDAILLLLVRALGTLGGQAVEWLLCKIDDVVCDSPSELDNELWLNIILPAIKAHQSTCPPPSRD